MNVMFIFIDKTIKYNYIFLYNYYYFLLNVYLFYKYSNNGNIVKYY